MAWLALALAVPCIVVVATHPLPPVHVERTSVAGLPADYRFVDEYGREVLFRGVNVVYKDPPWLPTEPNFNANNSWVAEDAKLLASMGFNLIRLGVMWPGVVPDRFDEVNRTYIEEIKKLIAIAAAEGMYTIIDPHQDELNPRFCGEGAPNWWVMKHTSVGDFPVPVRKTPFPVDPSRPCPGLNPELCPGIDFPGRDQCDLESSFSYIWTHAGAKAYQTLWENAEAFAAFWKTVAEEFHGLPGVIGGELWNEPFPGDVFGKPEVRKNQYADQVNLIPFYSNVTKAIREAVPSKKQFLIAYEPTWPVGDQDLHPESMLPSTSGFEQLPEDNGIYAFHWYVAPADANLSRYLETRKADAMRLRAAPYASEWNFGADSDSSADAKAFADTVAEFESRRVSYTGWQYKTYQASVPGGTCTGCGSSFFKDDGFANRGTFNGMSTPFAQAIAGRVISISTTPLDTRAQQRSYVIKFARCAAASASTVIVIPSGWLPKDDLKVDVRGGAGAHIAMDEFSGARLTDGVSYRAWTRLSVTHASESTASDADPVVVTITLGARSPEIYS